MRLLETRASLLKTSRLTSPWRRQYWSSLASQPIRAASGQTRLFSRISPVSPSAREQKSTISPQQFARPALKPRADASELQIPARKNRQRENELEDGAESHATNTKVDAAALVICAEQLRRVRGPAAV
jgi:hypothetical protein